MNNLDRLAVHDIVAVFFNLWLMRVPFFEVNVYVIVTNRLLNIGQVRGRGVGLGRGQGRGRGGYFPFWKNEFLWFYYDFMNVA